MIAVLALLLIASINLIVPRKVLAEPSKALEICGDGVNKPMMFSLSQLQAMPQYEHVYSTINTWPTKKWYVGRGVNLRDLLDLAGIKEDARLLIFTSSDGYEVTLTVKELLKDKRYYFPRLKENHSSDGSIPGSAAEAVEVEPILALVSTEGSDNPADMNDMDSLLLICGQRAVAEQTNNIFLKYISKIEVLTAAPQKWDNPRASMENGDVLAGTLIELSNKRNDSDKIHYTTDGSTPTVNSPIFNWSAKRWWNQRPDSLGNVNKPIEINQDTVIKAITIGPGKEDSEVVTFSYQIGSANTVARKEPGGPPTGVALDQNQVSLKVGGTFELEAIVGPDNAIDKRVIWSSSDTRVATVDNHGLVTVIGPGTADITVKTVVGNFAATCTVKVDNESSRGQVAPLKTLDLTRNEVQEETVSESEATEANQQDADENKTVTTASATVTKEEQSPVDSQIPQEKQRYLAPKDALTTEPDTPDILSQQADSLNGHVFEVSVEPEAIQMEINSLNNFTMVIFLILFLSGGVRRYAEYIKEVIS